MSDQQYQFQSRLQRLHRKHAGMRRGYSAAIRPDGLIVVKPRRMQSRIPGRAVALFLAAFLLFKAVLMASLGFDGYALRVARLQHGTAVERAGALLMQADPVSEYLALQIRPVLR
ncbi:hypothetical protein ACUXV3_18200 [Roseobacteraceae bacterium NS-SX3]